MTWFGALRVGLLGLLLAGPAFGQGLPDGVSAQDRVAIQGVIQHQLDAFRTDDAAGAWANAAPAIQRMFGDPQHFMEMVRRAYPPVYRPRSAEFSELALRDGELVQEVELVGPDGIPALAVYIMQRQPDGTWSIAGCRLIASARLSV